MFNKIPIRLPIILIYYLIFIGLFFQYIKYYLSVMKNWFFYIKKNASAWNALARYIIINYFSLYYSFDSNLLISYLLRLAFLFLPYPSYNYLIFGFIIAISYLKLVLDQIFSKNEKKLGDKLYDLLNIVNMIL